MQKGVRATGTSLSLSRSLVFALAFALALSCDARTLLFNKHARFSYSKRPLSTSTPAKVKKSLSNGKRTRQTRETSVARLEAYSVGRRSTTAPRVGVLCSRMDAMRTTCLVSRQVVGWSAKRVEEKRGQRKSERTGRRVYARVYVCVYLRTCTCIHVYKRTRVCMYLRRLSVSK